MRDAYGKRRPIGAPTLLKYIPGGMGRADARHFVAQIEAVGHQMKSAPKSRLRYAIAVALGGRATESGRVDAQTERGPKNATYPLRTYQLDTSRRVKFSDGRGGQLGRRKNNSSRKHKNNARKRRKAQE